MPPITPMPSAAAPRQTDPDDHKDCAARITAQFAQGVAPWARPWKPGESRLPEKHPNRQARTGVGIRSTSAPPKRRRVAVTRRCELLDVARSTVYDRPTGISAEDLALMRLVDEIH